MSEIAIIKEYAGLGAGVLLGGTGMYLMYKLQLANLEAFKTLLGDKLTELTNAIRGLEHAVTELGSRGEHNAEPQNT